MDRYQLYLSVAASCCLSVAAIAADRQQQSAQLSAHAALGFAWRLWGTQREVTSAHAHTGSESQGSWSCRNV